MVDLSEQDQELIAAAEEALARGFVEGRHHVAAALRAASGRILTGLHLEASVGRIAVCAEAIVLGRAISEGERERDFTDIVAVHFPDKKRREPRVISPCGMCRELIADYSPAANVIYLDEQGEVRKAKVQTLLPARGGWDHDAEQSGVI
jgi:cytidine deaminase